jgi:crotonobetainyl-CoA:carnitine CoA-transferase CaiB-like acyl-CoA transferase
MAGVFDGLRVVDLSWGIAGPMTSMLLADNGAEVTRLELERVDPFRTQAGYRVWNRGKRSVRCDLRTEEGHELARSLAERADVMIETFAPGTTERFGIDHDTCAAVNPGLITCSITGYGPLASLADRPGLDGLVAARTGLLFDQKGRRGTAMEYINGRPGPLPEFGAPDGLVRGADRDGPIFPRSSWPSIGATYFATLGIAAALRARAVTGFGQRVETSLLQGALAAACLNWQRVEDPDADLYWMWPVDSRSIEGLFECADGRWVHHWTLRPTWVLAASSGETLAAKPLDSAYRDDPDRVSMEPDGMLSGMFLYPELAAAFKKFPSHEWIAAAEAVGVGLALVRSPGEALNDEAFLADGCVIEVDDPDVGSIRVAGPALEFSTTPGAVTGPAPRVGTHTDEVVATLMSEPASTRRQASPGATLSSPLEGIRVLDLGLGVAGPFTGRVLADLGADVIKVNALHDSYWNGTHMGLGTNRGKRSISVNLKDPRGLDIVKRLIASADVFTTNWRPGAAARLGLDFETLHVQYPRLVHCNTRGYERGPRSDLPGTDQTAAALTGTEWVDGACDAGNPPLWSRSNMGDTGNALLAAIAISAALYHRELTGEGQAVSTSIVNAGLLHNSYSWAYAGTDEAEWERVDGCQHGLSPRYRLYRCADGNWIFLAAVRPSHRDALALLIEGADGDGDGLASVLEAAFGRESASEWHARLDRAGVPAELVDETFCRRLFDDPEARAVGLISETRSGAVGRFEDPGLLVNFSATPGVIQRGPCLSGEHSREILTECGFDAAEIDELVAANVIVQAG